MLGVPHPVLGEDVVACVVLRPGQEADADELRDHTLEHLARSKVPRRWYFVDALPRNATGKVVKDELRREPRRRPVGRRRRHGRVTGSTPPSPARTAPVHPAGRGPAAVA